MASKANAEVRPNVLFSDNMVLQRGIAVPIWGTAKDGEAVSVSFEGQAVKTVAKEGKWSLVLKPLKAGGPFKMTIKGENTVTINNILVGEVWVCGGQSNMERQLGPRKGQPLIENWEAEARDGINYPNIREFAVVHGASEVPLTEVKGKWAVCDSVTCKDFSAIGYFFAKALYQKIKIPIGIIHSSVGGTAVNKWISREAVASNPELTSIAAGYEGALKRYPKQLADYQANEASLMEKYKQDLKLAIANNQPHPRKPSPPVEPGKSGNFGGHYNAMIAPLIPYSIKGVVWYQGETDSHNPKMYFPTFTSLIADLRKRWQEGDFPWLFVQIAPNEKNAPEIREAQMLTYLKTPKTAMTVTTDCADSTFDRHPPFKKKVGERIALTARAVAYNEKIEFMGPIYKDSKVEGNKIIVTFTHADNGLVAKDGDLIAFSIADADKNFVPAKAVIKGNTLEVSADGVSKPAFVRFGFSTKPVANLYNKEGLPASPFRTDGD